MTLPNFVMIGAAKCGTTALAFHMARHPQVFMSWPKEPNWFGCQPSQSFAWYESLYDGVKDETAIGEASTRYANGFLAPAAPRMIAEMLPDVKLIHIARHPLQQIASYYRQVKSNGRIPVGSFDAALRSYSPLIGGAMYHRTIKRYLRYFDRDRILTLFFEDFTADPDGTLRRIFDFLGVDPEFRVPNSATPRHRSSDLKSDNWLGRTMRHTPMGRLYQRYMPLRGKRSLQAFYRGPLEVSTNWDPDTREWIIDLLAEDAARHLRDCGKPEDFWRFDAAPSTTEPTTDTATGPDA